MKATKKLLNTILIAIMTLCMSITLSASQLSTSQFPTNSLLASQLSASQLSDRPINVRLEILEKEYATVSNLLKIVADRVRQLGNDILEDDKKADQRLKKLEENYDVLKKSIDQMSE